MTTEITIGTVQNQTSVTANEIGAKQYFSNKINYAANGNLLGGKHLNEMGVLVTFCNGIQIGSELWNQLNDLDDDSDDAFAEMDEDIYESSN